jgi:hypothetical protein
LGKLAAVVPPPRRHLTRYLGVFAARSAVRALIVPQASNQDDGHQAQARPTGRADHPPAPLSSLAPCSARSTSARSQLDPRRADLGPPRLGQGAPAAVLERKLPWAALLERVHAIDVLECARCGGRMRVLCFVANPDAVAKILDHLGLPAIPPVAKPARAPPRQAELDGWPD